jgi:hypothetical protein
VKADVAASLQNCAVGMNRIGVQLFPAYPQVTIYLPSGAGVSAVYRGLSFTRTTPLPRMEIRRCRHGVGGTLGWVGHFVKPPPRGALD